MVRLHPGEVVLGKAITYRFTQRKFAIDCVTEDRRPPHSAGQRPDCAPQCYCGEDKPTDFNPKVRPVRGIQLLYNLVHRVGRPNPNWGDMLCGRVVFIIRYDVTTTLLHSKNVTNLGGIYCRPLHATVYTFPPNFRQFLHRSCPSTVIAIRPQDNPPSVAPCRSRRFRPGTHP